MRRELVLSDTRLGFLLLGTVRGALSRFGGFDLVSHLGGDSRWRGSRFYYRADQFGAARPAGLAARNSRGRIHTRRRSRSSVPCKMGASGLAHAFGCTLRAPNESKVYLAGFHVDPHQLHPDLIRQPVTLACTLANKGVMGIIPGSMGDASWVMAGAGNHAMLASACHGARFA